MAAGGRPRRPRVRGHAERKHRPGARAPPRSGARGEMGRNGPTPHPPNGRWRFWGGSARAHTARTGSRANLGENEIRDGRGSTAGDGHDTDPRRAHALPPLAAPRTGRPPPGRAVRATPGRRPPRRRARGRRGRRRRLRARAAVRLALDDGHLVGRRGDERGVTGLVGRPLRVVRRVGRDVGDRDVRRDLRRDVRRDLWRRHVRRHVRRGPRDAVRRRLRDDVRDGHRDDDEPDHAPS